MLDSQEGIQRANAGALSVHLTRTKSPPVAPGMGAVLTIDQPCGHSACSRILDISPTFSQPRLSHCFLGMYLPAPVSLAARHPLYWVGSSRAPLLPHCPPPPTCKQRLLAVMLHNRLQHVRLRRQGKHAAQEVLEASSGAAGSGRRCPTAWRRAAATPLPLESPLPHACHTQQQSAMYQGGPHLQAAAPQPWAAGAQWQQGGAGPQLPPPGFAGQQGLHQPPGGSVGEQEHQLHLALRRAAAAEERCHALEQQLAALQQESSALRQQLSEARSAAARAEAETERRMAAVGRLLADQAASSTSQHLARMHLGSNGSEHAAAVGTVPPAAPAPAPVPAGMFMSPAPPGGQAPPLPPFAPGKRCCLHRRSWAGMPPATPLTQACCAHIC